jgi:xanthine/CO dehydrogenase XdhC/CoxF family maturation factor
VPAALPQNHVTVRAHVKHDIASVLTQAGAWKRDGLGVALATVVHTWGSSPRPAGSKLAVNERGEFVGSVSGGCIEAAVIAEAYEVMRGAPPLVLELGVSDETAWQAGLACGGQIQILIEGLVT